MNLNPYEARALALGTLVDDKQRQYGAAVTVVAEMMRGLYPSGIPRHAYDDALLVVRVCDKLCRIATRGVERPRRLRAARLDEGRPAGASVGTEGGTMNPIPPVMTRAHAERVVEFSSPSGMVTAPSWWKTPVSVLLAVFGFGVVALATCGGGGCP